ncbi:MAG: sulfurtransferase TusA family protein [Parvibaculales bacterium]
MGKPRFLDARGLSCPLPTLKLRRVLEAMTAGDRVELHATDPMSAVDVPHFCAQHGHELVTQTEDAGTGAYPVHVFVIEKAGNEGV